MNKGMISVIHEEGVLRYPQEACGVVVRCGKKSVAVPCRNVADQPEHFFVMHHEDYAQAAQTGEVIGIWHTHVEMSNAPSVPDRVGCENSNIPWYIVSIFKADDEFTFSEASVTTPNGYSLPYEGRPYVFGVLDCWSLVRDYYRREYNILLGDYPRIESFWARGHDFFGENWQKEGFIRLDRDTEPAPGDLFLIQTDNSGNANHIAVYLGDDIMLHHAHGRISRRDIYGGFWHKHTSVHIRHKTKC